MTPLQIRMMLHYYAIAEPYAKNNPDHANSKAVAQQREELGMMDLIVSDRNNPSGYRATARGRAYVDALCAMPLPECKWIVPQRA